MNIIRTFQNQAQAKTVRRFLIIEGIYMNTGSICPLPEYIKLKLKHKFRIFVDESVSFGVLGKTGRGVVEHYSAQVLFTDIIQNSNPKIKYLVSFECYYLE